MKNPGVLPKLVTHAVLILLVTSPLLSSAKRLPTSNHQLTEEIGFGDNAGHRSEQEDSETFPVKKIHKAPEGEEEPPQEAADDHSEVAMTARHVVHESDLVAITYLKAKNEGEEPESTVFVAPMSDGQKKAGRGSPYLYVSQSSGLVDVTQKGTQCTLFAWRSDAGSCDYGRLPVDQDKCEHVILTGTFAEIDKSSEEYEYALADFFSRHEDYTNSKAEDDYFLVKFQMSTISVYYKADAPIDLPVEKYFEVADTVESSSAPDFRNSFAVKSFLSFTVFLNMFKIFS